MKKFILLIAIFSGLFITSCDNELNIAADWRNIPVIYAFVDAGEEVNYFRIEKGFLDPTIGGETIAQIADSLYYGPEVTARITNERNGNSVILQRVNLEDEGFVREEGTFATSPNIGYRLFTADLAMEADDLLTFELINGDDQIMTEAQATVIGGYEIANGQPANPMRIREDNEVSFGLRAVDNEQSARFYDLRLLFRYRENNINTGTSETLTATWLIDQGLERARTSASGGFQALTVFKIEGQQFYQFLGANIEENPNVSRTFMGVDLRYDAGGEDFFNFINIGQANTGITSNQIIPTFSNFNNNAVGVFSSRGSLENEETFNLNTEARDSLRDGRFTRNLNFN